MMEHVIFFAVLVSSCGACISSGPKPTGAPTTDTTTETVTPTTTTGFFPPDCLTCTDPPSTSPFSPTGCGVPAIRPAANRSSRIYGGTEARAHSWPWQVAICDGNTTADCRKSRCGGSIISNKFVLTAAHCVKSFGIVSKPHEMAIKVGAHRRSVDAVPLALARVAVHPKYQRPYIHNNDIALLELSNELAFNETVQPVCLPLKDNGNTEANGENVGWVTGWGYSEGGEKSEVLRQVDVPFVSDQDCKKIYPDSSVDERMLCMGDLKNGGKDACGILKYTFVMHKIEADSGGPAVKESNGRWFQYGIVSWGEGCARPGKPGVYTRLTEYCDFVKQITGQDVCVDGNAD